ncbi:transcription-repair coupling factor [Mobilibacterium timonense]|uniref:transcription-repair coupling factor n=1 Tax=Mobilibacterium timonense TaxID=1871012 RepID=UPI000987B393|nr:transcription-repair coupling factor [Mobilibacterium timonense]
MRIEFSGTTGSRIAYYGSRLAEEYSKAVIIVSTEKVAQIVASDLAYFLKDGRKICTMPEEDDIRIVYEVRDMDTLTRRMKALDALTGPEPAVVVAPVSAAMRKLERKERFLASVQFLETGQILEPEALREDLVLAGYSPAPVTENPGEFSIRGGLIDVFPPGDQYPVRIEFFDDEIDSLRTFDPETQRSVENLNSIRICPAAEIVPSEDERIEAWSAIRDEYDRRILECREQHAEEDVKDGRIERLEGIKGRIQEIFESGTSPRVFGDYMDYFHEGDNYLWDYLDDGILMVADPERVAQTIPEYQDKDAFRRIYDKDDLAVFSPFPMDQGKSTSMDEVVAPQGRQAASYNGQLGLFVSDVRHWLDHGYQIRIVTENSDRSQRIREYLNDSGIYGKIQYDVGDLSSGMIIQDEKLSIITETDIFPDVRKHRKRKKKKNRNSIDFSDLHKGDYVVHESHGIGRFEGIVTLDKGGDASDYLKIHYAGSDVLYIPTEQMDIVQKYIGNEGEAPKLSRLSGGDWRNARQKARRAIEAIAEDLVKLYAQRQEAGGYPFSKDTVWQAEFEDEFPYEETDDQLQAIHEIKEDMEKPLPMDRLLCGDVGYGKTEVAARAIFKCLADGKQAVLLAPTTLLVDQHYHNMKERFRNFPFNIEMLSRFRDEEQQKKIVEGLKRGTIDFVVGTHRLLSSDVKFKDLGLLVIDEEQRFGVKHKEKIKMLRKSVDVLTLSATPIPRTLNMSLTGIKDISIIEEPPGDRLPVQTFVTPYDEELISGVIKRELARGGQAYVISNRVRGIRDIAENIQELVPEAKVAVGHGQMGEKTLENIMIDFTQGNSNVLVATTIIENGIDIPNANTIIILNADKFGLSQLYQLRGRVGRSSRLAYAYLMYDPQRQLTEIAEKRLSTIREFTEFGAGFKISMRDLELRGAGNVLGEAQHGHIAGIGYELYCKEIDRAVRRLKGETVTETRADISINLDVPARIPDSYISDETLKLQAYKKIAQIWTREDGEDVINELIDRFGDIPDPVMNLIKVAEIRSAAEKIGVEEINVSGRKVHITFGGENNMNAYVLVMAKQEFGERLAIRSGENPELDYFAEPDQTAADEVLKLMETLDEKIEESKAVGA